MVKNMSSLEVLKHYWGYPNFRLIQQEIIDNVLSGNDTFALMETGGGKSICFQVPTLMTEGMTIVISPLIALMKDQVDALRERGISAAFVNSQLDKRTLNNIYIDCEDGKYKFLYLSPERLKNKSFLRSVLNCNVKYIVIDEGHTISEWGQDFRTSYLNISKFKMCFPDAPLIVVTATANEYVKKEIIKTLQLREGYKIIQSTFARSNINIDVREEQDKLSFIKAYLSERKGQTGIIYTNRRLKAERIAKLLIQEGFNAEYYHGGLSSTERTIRQENWIKGKADVMVCTNAFGMGIDKDNVRFVFHVDFPNSLEGYYQEIGRGGRDGKDADGIFLYSSTDIKDHIRQEIRFPDFEQTKDLYFWMVGNFPRKVKMNQAFIIKMQDVCLALQSDEEKTFRAFKILETHGYISMHSSTSNYGSIALQKTYQEITALTKNDHELTVVMFRLKVLLRGKKGTGSLRIDLAKWRSNSKMELDKFKRCIEKLESINAMTVRYDKPTYLTKVTKKASPNEFTLKMGEVTDREDHLKNQQQSLMSYVANSSVCRMRKILSYFGEHTDKDCGKCDVCESKNNSNE